MSEKLTEGLKNLQIKGIVSLAKRVNGWYNCNGVLCKITIPAYVINNIYFSERNMKFDPEIKKDIGFMALGCGICSLVCVLVFAVIGQMDLSVILGAVIGFVLSLGNFVLMSYGIVKALETGDEVEAKLKMKRSYTLRTIVMLAVMGVSLAVSFIHWVPVVVSVFYPRIAITCRNVYRSIKTRNDPAPEYTHAVEDGEDEEEESTDEFEKFVGGFSKGVDYDTKKNDKK